MSNRSAHVPRFPHGPHDLWRQAGIEPPLADVLRDPVVQAVMRRDGVTPDELLRVIAEAQAQLRRRLCRRAA